MKEGSTTPPMVAAQRYDNVLLITIHGVYSDNTGPGEFGDLCAEQLPGLCVYNANYDSLHPLIPMSAKARGYIYRSIKMDFDTINKEITQQGGQFSKVDKIIVAAHSLGTLAFHESLTDTKSDPINLKFDHVLLSGSIIERRTNWSYWIKNGTIRNPPVNIVRPFDLIVRQGKYYTGKDSTSGSRGFVPFGNRDLSAINIFKSGGHTSYYPDDVKEVVDLIKYGKINQKKVSGSEFISSLSALKRNRLRFYRAMRLT